MVYCKEPFADPKHLMNYLGRYTHRVAISNQRILEITDSTVTFRYKDYADNNKLKSMTLSHIEFIRRFLLHILPSQFVKIRHYGLLANRTRRVSLQISRELLSKANRVLTVNPEEKDWNHVLRSVIEKVLLCSLCKSGTFVSVSLIPKYSHPP